MPLRDDLTESERIEAEILLAIGRLSRYFHTPISYFEGLDPVDLETWLNIMDELIRLENEAIEKQVKGGR